MRVNDVVFHLEMTAPSELVPADPAPKDVRLREVWSNELQTVKDVHDRLAGPFYWRSLDWTEEQWRECMNRGGIRTWLGEVDAEPMALVQLHLHPDAEVEFDFFGVVPEFVGMGYGGHLLTIATRRAWDFRSAGRVRRVWLKTSCHDHPNARRNYEARGYRHFHTETIPRDLVMPRA